MSTSDFDNFNGGSDGDDLIEQLLTSENPDDRNWGLYQLSETKAEAFCGLLQAQCNRIGGRLQTADLADLWQATLVDIWVNVEQGNFAKTGALDGYVYTIFKRRAVDFVRRRRVRFEINPDSDVDLDAVASCGERDETPSVEFEWQLLYYIMAVGEHRGLSTEQMQVIKHYVILLLAKNALPSLAELTAAVNIERDSNKEAKLSENAVKSAKKRAIQKMRGKKDNGETE